MGFANPIIPHHVRTVVLTNDNQVASGDTVQFLLTPPRGWLWQVIAIDITAVAIGTSGTHEVDVTSQAEGFSEFVRHLRGVSNFGVAVEFRWSHWFTADSTALPPNADAQVNAMRGLTADPTRPIRYSYSNDTDAAQAAGDVSINTLVHGLRIEET